MIFFPNCKINLGLHILQRRNDGFHDLETVFYPLPLTDALEVVRQPAPASEVDFSTTGLMVDGAASDNICVKAYRLLKKDHPELPAVKMHLHKTIPLGAGLGGGSANGAFTLLLLNKKFGLGLTEDQLLAYALQLGSDCPFFIRNTPCFATGRGEKMVPLAIDLSAYRFVVVNPGIHVNTGWAFSQIKPSAGRPSLKDVIQLPVADWQGRLVNDFEDPVCQHHPSIAQVKEELYQQGAIYASMTGSGSTVFGIFPGGEPPALSFPENYFVRTV